MSSAEKAKTAVHEGRVKLHVFEPSGRQVWTVVGKSGEHWVDKETEFCSCSAYFFGKMRDGKGCYHVSSVQMSGTNVQTTKFPDSNPICTSAITRCSSISKAGSEGSIRICTITDIEDRVD